MLPEGTRVSLSQGGTADFQQGKSSDAMDLKSRLPLASSGYLQGALQNPCFGEEHLAPAFSNPSLASGLIQQIAANRRWLSRSEVQRAIVFHRNSPLPLKLNLVHFLGWKDLSRTLEDHFIAPPVKKKAETLLKARVAQMALGERIALARIAAPGVIATLRSDLQGEVIAALLGNHRLVEDEVMLLCGEERAPAEVLAAVGTHPKWRQRAGVRLQLLRTPRTPAAISLGFLDSLSASDLEEIAALSGIPRLVRATAKQLLESRRCFVDRTGAVS